MLLDCNVSIQNIELILFLTVKCHVFSWNVFKIFKQMFRNDTITDSAGPLASAQHPKYHWMGNATLVSY